MLNKERKNNSGVLAGAMKEGYEGKVAVEALQRVGKNKQIHGIVHEILVKDTLNANPGNIVNGTKAVLSKSTTAVRDDILLKQGGKIVGRMQLKDTSKSICKTVKQVAEGHYKGTALIGTKETTSAFNSAVGKKAAQGIKITQKMQSSGVSSADTARIATKALGGSISKTALTSAAKSSGAFGAAISGGIETVSAGKDLIDGRISGEEFAGRVAKETFGGGLSSAGGAIAGTAVATAATGLLATASAPVWVPAAIGVAATVAVGTGIKSLWDSIW